MQRRHHDCRTYRPTAALPTTWCLGVGHMARTDTSEGQVLWQPEGAEEGSGFREGDRHLRLAYEEAEEAADAVTVYIAFSQSVLAPTLWRQVLGTVAHRI